MEKTRKCPYCGEEIMSDARKCRHCGEWLNDETEKKEFENQPKNEEAEETKPDEGSLTETIPNKSKVSLFRSCFWEQMTKHYCDFKGVVDRKTFWICFLYYILIMLVTSGISAIAPLLGTIVWLIVSLGLTLPWMGLYVRRLRDIGKKWMWIFLLLPGFFLSFVSKILPSSSGLVLAFLLVSLGGVVWFFVLMALRGKTQNPNKWNWKDTIITILMMIFSVVLFTVGLLAAEPELGDVQESLSEEEKKSEAKEIEKQFQEACNTGSFFDFMTPEFMEAYEGASAYQEFLGSHWLFRFDLLVEFSEALIEVQRISVVDKGMAKVYITHAFDNEKQIVDSSILIMKTGMPSGLGNTKWLIDDVQYYEEYDHEIQFISSEKKEMIKYANKVSKNLDEMENKEEIEKLVVNAYKTCSIKELMTPEFIEAEDAMLAEIKEGYNPSFSTEEFYRLLGCSEVEVLGIDFLERFDGLYIDEARVLVKQTSRYGAGKEINTVLVLACDRHSFKWLVDDVLVGDFSYRNAMMDFVHTPAGVHDNGGMEGFALHHFIGQIAGAKIHMSIMEADLVVQGRYYYDSKWAEGDKASLSLYGNCNGSHLRLTESVNNMVTGVFEGEWNDGIFEGTFTRANDGKGLSFRLIETEGVPGFFTEYDIVAE